MAALAFPSIDPVAFSLGPFGPIGSWGMIGPLEIRWYALAYLAGFILGWQTCMYLARQNPHGPKPEHYDEFLTWAVLGVVLGGRIGYILFYQPDHYISHPLEMLQVWHGGMSFHGGLMGVIIVSLIFTRMHKLNFWSFTDVLACVTPIGLGLGRIANFINGELYGRITDVWWGMVFPCRHGVPEDLCPGPLPRHPSQLYEAVLEGVVLFIIMFLLSRNPKIRGKPGCLSGCFLVGYGIFRFSVEFFREPDPQLGFLFAGATMGQLLCIPMILFGMYLIISAERRAWAI